MAPQEKPRACPRERGGEGKSSVAAHSTFAKVSYQRTVTVMTHRIESSAFGWYHSLVMMKWQTCNEVSRNPQVVSGDYVFKGTRVPVRALFENIEDGATVNDFLDWFPGVTRSQVEAVFEHAVASLAVGKLA